MPSIAKYIYAKELLNTNGYRTLFNEGFEVNDNSLENSLDFESYDIESLVVSLDEVCTDKISFGFQEIHKERAYIKCNRLPVRKGRVTTEVEGHITITPSVASKSHTESVLPNINIAKYFIEKPETLASLLLLIDEGAKPISVLTNEYWGEELTYEILIQLKEFDLITVQKDIVSISVQGARHLSSLRASANK